MTQKTDSKNDSSHSWDENEIRQYGDARCSGCSMKHSYYHEALASLRSWPKKEQNDEWKEKMEWYQT